MEGTGRDVYVMECIGWDGNGPEWNDEAWPISQHQTGDWSLLLRFGTDRWGMERNEVEGNAPSRIGMA